MKGKQVKATPADLAERAMLLDELALSLGMQRFTHPRREADQELTGRIWLYRCRCSLEAVEGPVPDDHFLKNTTFPKGCVPPVLRAVK